MVTPASFGVNACPHAIPAESTKIPHKAKVSFFTTYSFLDCQMCHERLPKLRINIRQVAHVEKVYRKLERAALGIATLHEALLVCLKRIPSWRMRLASQWVYDRPRSSLSGAY